MSDASSLSPPVALPADEAHILYTRQENIRDPELLKRYADMLSPDERKQWQRFKFEKHRHTYLVAHALVRCALSRYSDIEPAAWEFMRNNYGRPDVSRPVAWRPIRFNLSHTTGMVAVIVAWDREVGVDVEWIDRPNLGPGIANRFFSPQEVRDLRALPEETQQKAFFNYWTLKEAYIKARGMGLSIPLDQFSFRLRSDEPIGISFAPELEDDPNSWYFERHTPTNSHTLSLALRSPNCAALKVSVQETTP